MASRSSYCGVQSKARRIAVLSATNSGGSPGRRAATVTGKSAPLTAFTQAMTSRTLWPRP